jgi:hypothetical protein
MNTLLTYVFVTMLYSGGLPLLYPISAAYFGVTYWVDKYLLTKFYRKPPTYDTKLAKSALYWFKWAFVLHFICAYHMFKENSILQTDPFGDNNMKPRDVLNAPSEIYLNIFLFFIMFYLIWRYCLRHVVKICCKPTKGAGLKNDNIHQDFYQKCSFSTLVAIWKSTFDAVERMADNSLFTTTNGFVNDEDIQGYLGKGLYPRSDAIETRIRGLAKDCRSNLNKL